MATVLAVLLLVTAAGIVAYWVLFALDVVEATGEDWYLRFERAFPVPDVATALAATAGGVGLLLGRPWGDTFGLVAAGGLVFLGLIDISFNVQNGLYRKLPGSAEMWMEAVINVWTLGLGAWLVAYLVGRAG